MKLRFLHHLLAGLSLIIAAAPAHAVTCDLDFSVEITHGVGPYRPGTILEGTASFTTERMFRQEGGAMAHLSTGMMTVDDDITGRLWAVITTMRTHANDMIALHAIDVEGLTYVGQEFRGPMTLTLFGDPGSWGHERPPLTQAEWDSLNVRRSFQLLASPWNEALSGEIIRLVPQCVDSAPPQE